MSETSLGASPVDRVGESEFREPRLGFQRILDSVAVLLAGACGVHCLLLPLIFVAVPALSGALATDPRFHLWMLALAGPTTALAVFLGCRRHRDRWVMALSAVGLATLAAAAVWGYLYHLRAGHVGEPGAVAGAGLSEAASLWASHPESLATSLGGLMIALAHARNYRLCRRERCAH